VSATPARPAGVTAEGRRVVFHGGAVVQLVDAERPAVVTLHPATVHLSDRRLVAMADGSEWSWVLDDVSSVTHAPSGAWSIVAVPGVEDHGVQVRHEDVARFRLELAAALPGPGRGTEPAPAHQRNADAFEAVLDLTAAHQQFASPPTPAPAPTTPPPAEDLPPPDRPPTESREAPQAPPAPAGRSRSPASSFGERLAAVIERLDPRPRSGPPTGAGAARDFRNRQPLAALEAREISAWFGTHHVLDRVSLEVPAGQVTALIGPSGCGKSTFLRILNRMHEMIPSASLAGHVILDGTDIYDPQRRLTDARRQIGMVFQKPNPFPAMSIYDNVVASFRLTGLKADQDERDEVVESCLRKAGLWNEVKDRLRQPGGGLSGGQQQRLCIARALAIRPRVLLMDEPCSALDPTSTRRIEQTIEELAEEVTIVIVTHNMQQAARVSHRCAFFLAEQGTPGVIVEHGPTSAMFDSPQDQRTLDYVTGRFG